MANPEHLAILKQGVDVWNKWRKENQHITPILNNANLGEADLSGANLSETDLTNADLSGSHLVGADFCRAEITGVNFNGAVADHVDFWRASIHGCHITDASLTSTDFSDAQVWDTSFAFSDLGGAVFRNTGLVSVDFALSFIGATVFANIDFCETEGLESVHHHGPSTIGIDTIYKSKGQIPESFLRGCGVPDELIKLIPSLTSQPIDYFSCFLSHSSLDKSFCERLYNDLRGAHVRTWYFPEDAKWGNTVWGEIDRSIKVYDKLVVICSKNSLQSGPVLREIERALQREDREHKNVLFPIAIDKYVFDEWDHPRRDDVLAKVVGDFIGWDTDAAKYDDSFKRLLVELQAED